MNNVPCVTPYIYVMIGSLYSLHMCNLKLFNRLGVPKYMVAYRTHDMGIKGTWSYRRP